jgi:hypothetical protein
MLFSTGGLTKEKSPIFTLFKLKEVCAYTLLHFVLIKEENKMINSSAILCLLHDLPCPSNQFCLPHTYRGLLSLSLPLLLPFLRQPKSLQI